ncbi:hypothetical protein T484DRAFT_1967951 [Baffinella frigidus]|nr:hypothetical protein T484DRAFT_1967951 [Cryptophyta sp. CCMP2293]
MGSAASSTLKPEPLAPGITPRVVLLAPDAAERRDTGASLVQQPAAPMAASLLGPS